MRSESKRQTAGDLLVNYKSIWRMLLFRELLVGVFCAALASSAATAQYKRGYNPEFKLPGHTPEWVEFESDVGSIYSLDMKSFQYPFGRDPNAPWSVGGQRSTVGDWINIVEAVILDPEFKLLWYRFDCKGHAYDVQARLANIFIPPRSVLGAIEKTVCTN
jgi:hypothetical protein